MSRSAGCMILSAMLLWVVSVAGAGVTTCVSVASNGAYGNASSSVPAISGNGRFVAFKSSATNLVPGDTNGQMDVFVHDRLTGGTTRVSVATGGGQGNGASEQAAINRSGRYVAFSSTATNLVPGDTNGFTDVFLHDRQTGQTTRVSVASDGTQANSNAWRPSISGDGRYVAFESGAGNLVPGDTNGAGDAFVHDTQTGQTTRVSVANDGSESNGNIKTLCISANGRYVAFCSFATNLVPGGTDGHLHVFVRDRLLSQTTIASVASDGTHGNADSDYPIGISADGRFVAFPSTSTNLVLGDTNGMSDVFVRDRQTGETTRASVASDESEGNSASGSASISGDGRYVAFKSQATNLVPGDTNGYMDVFVRDRQLGQTSRVSIATDGSQGSGDQPSISRDGQLVAFMSTHFGGGPSADVFVNQRTPSPFPDMWVSARGDWVGDDIYNTTGRGQSMGRVVAEGHTATYRLKIQNDGSAAGPFTVQGTGGGTYWQVRYFDRPTGGTNITTQVTGGGFQTPAIAPGAAVIGRLEVTPLSGAEGGSRYTVAVSATLVGASTPKDVVKANTTVRVPEDGPQIAGLSALPTPAGAQVVFTLSGAATVNASVRNIAGRLVRTICTARECEAGTNTLLWNAQADSGLAVPDGVYLLEIAARAPEGTESRALTSVTLER